MWLKFLIIWRFARLWALCDGIEVVENMQRCVCDLAETLPKSVCLRISPKIKYVLSYYHKWHRYRYNCECHSILGEIQFCWCSNCVIPKRRANSIAAFHGDLPLTSTQATIIASPASGVDGNLAKIEKVVLDHLGRAWIIWDCEPNLGAKFHLMSYHHVPCFPTKIGQNGLYKYHPTFCMPALDDQIDEACELQPMAGSIFVRPFGWSQVPWLPWLSAPAYWSTGE